jgi:hypothetical protein
VFEKFKIADLLRRTIRKLWTAAEDHIAAQTILHSIQVPAEDDAAGGNGT